MIKYKYMLLVGVVMMALGACSSSVAITPEVFSTDVAEASLQATATQPATQESTPTLAQTPSFVATGTTAPLADDDEFLIEMRSKGYRITQSGSIVDEHGVVYSAYIFREPWENQSDRLESFVKETWIIAFYRWDGLQNELLNTFYSAVYNKSIPDGSYPELIALANWDNPISSFGWLEIFIVPDEMERSLLRLEGFSSDINHNNKPEFMILSQYCPISCSRVRHAVQFYEISEDTQIVELAADLPGHIEFTPYSTDPVLYAVNQEKWYGFISQINAMSIYQWGGDGFEDVTIEYSHLMLEEIETKLGAIQYGPDVSFVAESTQELMIEVLQTYQQIDMREKGLEVFLDLTYPDSWSGIDQESICWLQVARATAQDEFKLGVPFSIPHSTHTYLDTYINSIQFFIQERNLRAYDVSACMVD